MSKRLVVLIGAGVVAVAVALLMWKGRSSTDGARPGPAHASGSAGARTPGDTGPASGIDAVVRAADGAPVERAVVRIGGGDERDLAPHATGADGRASFDLAPGHYRVTAAAAGRAPAETIVDVATGARAAVELKLGATAPVVKGVVSDATGGPVAGAVVRIAAQPGGLGADEERATAAFTDPTGRFETSVLPGRYQVQTRHPEYLGDTRTIDVGPAGAELAIQLAPGAVVEGHVVDRAGGSVAGAKVDWSRQLGNAGPFGGGRADRGTVTAGADGAFRISGIGAGRVELGAATDDGRATREPVEIELGIAESLAGVEVPVVAAPSITGVVVRADNKQPVPGAVVMVEAPGDVSGTTADDKGRFRITAVAPGTHRLTARAHDALEGDPVTVQVGAAPIAPVTLTVKTGAFITGRVEPPGPAEISEELPEDVNLMGEGMMRIALGGTRARTEPDGTFKIGPFADGEVHLKARAADGRQGAAVAAVPARGDVVIALEQRGTIAGRVVDGNGDPLPGVVVSFRHRGGKAQRTMVVNGVDVGADRAPVDAAGAFSIAGREEGGWELSVLDGRGTVLPFAKGDPDKAVRVSLGKGETKQGVELAVDAPTGSIRGVVIDQSGNPVPDAWVTVAATETLFPGMGGKIMRRRPGDALPTPPPPGPGDDEDMESRTMTVASVIDDSGGGGMAGEVPPVLTGSDGSFTVSGLRKGKYDVTAEGLKGGARGMTPDVAVEHGPVETKVKVFALGAISGVVAQGGKPVVDFRVAAEGPSDKRKQVHADDGSYRMSGLDPGTYTVTARTPGGTGSAKVEVVAGKTAQAAIELIGDAHVRGTIVDAAGAPLADRMVLVLPRQPKGSMSIQLDEPPPRTGATGAFDVETPAGPRTLLVMGPQGPELQKDIDVKPGEQLDLGTVKAEPMQRGPGGPGPGPGPSAGGGKGQQPGGNKPAG